MTLLVGRFVETKIISVFNKNKSRFNNGFSHAVDLKQEAHLQFTRGRSRVNWKEFVRFQVRAKEIYAVLGSQLSAIEAGIV